MIANREAPSRPAALAGWSALAVAAGAIATVQLLGPSAAEAPLGAHDNGTTPPLHLHVSPSPWLVTALLVVAIAAGCLALALALVGRWRPSPRRLTLAGLVVAGGLSLLPPVGSADPLSYAAYGRMAATGHDAYATEPATLAPTDPVARAVQPPWQHEPSVYGPLATGEQALAAEIGGADPAVIVLVLDLIGGAAFVAVGWLLARTATSEEQARRRAVLWSANPLLWLQVVAGAHLDVLVAAGAVGAVLLARRRPVVAAAITAVAAIVKPAGGVAWPAIAWTVRRRPRTLVAVVAAAATIVIPAYAAAGPDAVRALGRAGRRISRATPWRPLIDHAHLPRAVIGVMSVAVAAAVVAALLRRRADRGDPAAIAAALATAYVLAAPYALPWYDALPFALLALVATSRVDLVLVAHTVVLSLAYLPGRDGVALPRALDDIARAVRSDIAPAIVAVLVLVAIVSRVRPPSSAASGARPLRP